MKEELTGETCRRGEEGRGNEFIQRSTRFRSEGRSTHSRASCIDIYCFCKSLRLRAHLFMPLCARCVCLCAPHSWWFNQVWAELHVQLEPVECCSAISSGRRACCARWLTAGLWKCPFTLPDSAVFSLQGFPRVPWQVINRADSFLSGPVLPYMFTTVTPTPPAPPWLSFINNCKALLFSRSRLTALLRVKKSVLKVCSVNK